MDFDNIRLDSFPLLEGTDLLNEIRLRNIRNLTIPDRFCIKKNQLERIRIRNSTIERFPRLSRCAAIRKIDLISNKIRYVMNNFELFHLIKVCIYLLFFISSSKIAIRISRFLLT